MTQDEWTSLLRAATAESLSQADRAASLRELVARTRIAADKGIRPWHLCQALGLLAEVERDRGRLEESAHLDLEAAANAEACAVQARHAAAFAYAQAALRYFELGQGARGMELAERAFGAADVFVDPSMVFEQLLATVRSFRQQQSTHGG